MIRKPTIYKISTMHVQFRRAVGISAFKNERLSSYSGSIMRGIVRPIFRVEQRLSAPSSQHHRSFHNAVRVLLPARHAPEPPHMVREDEKIDPQTIKVPYLNDTMRMDIYKKHVSDPEQWSAVNLAQHYGASVDRINGVIFLMHKRKEIILRDNKRLLELAKEEIPADEELLKRIDLVQPSLQVPATLKGLYEQYLLDTTKTGEVVLQEYNTTCSENGKEPLSISAEDATEALKLIDTNAQREKDLRDHNEIMARKMQLYSDIGVDVSAFRETGRTSVFQGGRTSRTDAKNIPGIIDTSSKAADAGGKGPKRAPIMDEFDIPQSLLDKYFPRLINDADVVKEQQRLLRRIAMETQAQVPVYDTKYFNDTFSTNLAVHGDDSADSAAAAGQQDSSTQSSSSAAATDSSISPAGNFGKSMRWKLAYRDLSKDPPIDRGGRGSRTIRQPAAEDGGVTPPLMMNRTIICTRSGKLRLATPLEESGRSWRPRPKELDRQLMTQLPFNNEKFIAPYMDYDGDDAIMQQQADERRERHKAMLADTEAVAARIAALTQGAADAPKKRKRKSKAKKAK